MDKGRAQTPQPHPRQPSLPLFLTLTTLFLGTLGACVGYAWSLPSVVLPLASSEDLVWVTAWTVIGSIQGACMAPAYHLGQGLELRGYSRLILAFGSALTSCVALCLWQGLGRGGHLSLLIASGLLVMCAAPLCAYYFGRRTFVSVTQPGI